MRDVYINIIFFFSTDRRKELELANNTMRLEVAKLSEINLNWKQDLVQSQELMWAKVKEFEWEMTKIQKEVLWLWEQNHQLTSNYAKSSETATDANARMAEVIEWNAANSKWLLEAKNQLAESTACCITFFATVSCNVFFTSRLFWLWNPMQQSKTAPSSLEINRGEIHSKPSSSPQKFCLS